MSDERVPIDEDGGSAFPCQDQSWDGMSLRDWFAGQAMAALIPGQSASWGISDLVESAYDYADEMLIARKR